MKKIIKKIVIILSLICIGLLFIGKTAVKADDVDNYNINSKALYCSVGNAVENGYNTTGDNKAVMVVSYMYRRDFEQSYF